MSAFDRNTYHETGSVCDSGAPFDEFEKCSTCGFSNTELFQSFFVDDGQCVNQFRIKLFDTDGGATFEENLVTVQTSVNRIFEFTLGDGNSNYDPTGTDEFQNYLYENICHNDQLPGVCDNFLRNRLCIDRPYTSMGNEPATAKFCGCYIPPDNADVLYGGVSISAVVPDNPDPAIVDPDIGAFPCFSTCNRSDTVRLYSPVTGDKYGCNNSSCSIDDVLLDLDNTNAVNVNITQVCPSCTPDNICTCIFSSSDIDNNDKVNLSFTQDCGENSICYLESDGVLTPVDCQTFFTQGESEEEGKVYNFWTSTIVIVFLVVAALALIILLITGKKKAKEVEPVGEKKKKPGDSAKKDLEKGEPKNGQ